MAESLRQGGAQAEFHEMDVTNSDQVNAVIARLGSNDGPLASLVCNAGIARKIPLSTMTDEQWDTTLDVDLKGMVRMIRAAAPAVRVARCGVIVCLASVVGTNLGWGEQVP